jgi:adenylosuccinate lyase
MDRLAKFSQEHASTVTVGRTHWQTASLVTVGKRGVLWLQELLVVFKKVCFQSLMSLTFNMFSWPTSVKLSAFVESKEPLGLKTRF